MTATLGQVEPFDPQVDDWVQYSERLEHYFVANTITEDKKKVAILVTVIGGKAYALLQNVLAPAKPADKSFDSLVKIMKDHLKPKPLVIAEKFKFHRRNQREGETVGQYLAELRKLTEQCNFREYLEEALRDRLVCGLRSEVIQRRLLAKEDLTLQEAFEIAYSMEMADCQASELQESSKTAVAVQRVKPSSTANASTPKSVPNSCYRLANRAIDLTSVFTRLKSVERVERRGTLRRCVRRPIVPRNTYLYRTTARRNSQVTEPDVWNKPQRSSKKKRWQCARRQNRMNCLLSIPLVHLKRPLCWNRRSTESPYLWN